MSAGFGEKSRLGLQIAVASPVSRLPAGQENVTNSPMP